MNSHSPFTKGPAATRNAKSSHPRQGELPLWTKTSQEDALPIIARLRQMHKRGLLGGNRMPEDSNPQLNSGSAENYHYFTLPMALNYQRNSYTLWEAASQTYRDPGTRDVFYPAAVCNMAENELRSALAAHKLALQLNKQTVAWRKLCDTFCALGPAPISWTPFYAADCLSESCSYSAGVV